MHQSSLEKMARFRDTHLARFAGRPLTVYDLGSLSVSGGSYRPLFQRPHWTYRGIDLAPGPNVDIVLKNPYHWREIRADSVDVVISGQAFEHIEFFWLTVFEIRRVLKPGGLMCLIAPSSGPIHRYPVDCWRFYPDGFRALARMGRFHIRELYLQDGLTGLPDGSDKWRDLVLVAEKPATARGMGWLKVQLLHFVLRHCAKALVAATPAAAVGKESPTR